jgi:hypothetical protein
MAAFRESPRPKRATEIAGTTLALKSGGFSCPHLDLAPSTEARPDPSAISSAAQHAAPSSSSASATDPRSASRGRSRTTPIPSRSRSARTTRSITTRATRTSMQTPELFPAQAVPSPAPATRHAGPRRAGQNHEVPCEGPAIVRSQGDDGGTVCVLEVDGTLPPRVRLGPQKGVCRGSPPLPSGDPAPMVRSVPLTSILIIMRVIITANWCKWLRMKGNVEMSPVNRTAIIGCVVRGKSKPRAERLGC